MKTNYLNKKILKLATIIAAVIFLLTPQISTAQTTYKITSGNEKNVKVLGSSNIHDWTMNSTVMVSQGDFKFDKNNILQTLSDFNFTIDARSLKSGHTSMDNRTYTAMKADANPKIIYKLTSAVITPVSANEYQVKSVGSLSIAGETHTIQMNLKVIVNADKTLTCTGSEKLKLTDYKIDPPSYMFGAMKVGNDLTIQFNLLYKS
ncbi:MAG: YceI family protein [Bacteroidota bacterium]|nr:YceI family protein [Bacteroidota bacterium]